MSFSTMLRNRYTITITAVVLAAAITGGVLLAGKMSADRAAEDFRSQRSQFEQSLADQAATARSITFSDQVIIGRTATTADVTSRQRKCSELEAKTKSLQSTVSAPTLSEHQFDFLSNAYREARDEQSEFSGPAQARTAVIAEAEKVVRFCQEYVTDIREEQKTAAETARLEEVERQHGNPSRQYAEQWKRAFLDPWRGPIPCPLEAYDEYCAQDKRETEAHLPLREAYYRALLSGDSAAIQAAGQARRNDYVVRVNHLKQKHRQLFPAVNVGGTANFDSASDEYQKLVRGVVTNQRNLLRAIEQEVGGYAAQLTAD